MKLTFDEERIEASYALNFAIFNYSVLRHCSKFICRISAYLFENIRYSTYIVEKNSGFCSIEILEHS